MSHQNVEENQRLFSAENNIAQMQLIKWKYRRLQQLIQTEVKRAKTHSPGALIITVAS